MLSISDYTPHKRAVRDRVGVRADFRVKPVPTEGVVYQNIKSVYTLGGKTATYRFTEAWRVGKQRRETGKIEQNGTDSFMVNRGDVKKAAGRLRVDAVAWYVPGKIGSAFVKGEGDNLWGGLHGKMGQTAVPEGTLTINRKSTAKWTKGGAVVWTLDGAVAKQSPPPEASDEEAGSVGPEDLEEGRQKYLAKRRQMEALPVAKREEILAKKAARLTKKKAMRRRRKEGQAITTPVASSGR
jgi:hypothetical protein